MSGSERLPFENKPKNPTGNLEKSGQLYKGYGEEKLVWTLADRVINWAQGNSESLDALEIDIDRYESGLDSYHVDDEPFDPMNVEIGSIDYRAGVKTALARVIEELKLRGIPK